jgi:transcriptional regulator with XRE-family HTH domain
MTHAKPPNSKINPGIKRAWFRGKLRDIGRTQAELAAFMRLDPSGVSLLLNGERRLQFEHAEQMAKFLGVPVSEVVSNAGLEIERRGAGVERRLPITGAADATGLVTYAKANGTTASVPDTTPARAVAVRMESGFAPGAAIVFVPSDTIEIAALGRLSVVTMADGSQRLGVPTASNEGPGRFNVSLPKGMLEGAELAAATPVLWIRP